MMSEVEKEVNTTSVEFKQGVEAGLNSEEDTKNWKAGNELGQELKEEEVETAEPASAHPHGEPALPLFLKGSPEGLHGNAQDEKDGMAE
jgi:hypothetical protein